jgi:hypothetical protein
VYGKAKESADAKKPAVDNVAKSFISTMYKHSDKIYFKGTMSKVLLIRLLRSSTFRNAIGMRGVSITKSLL